MYPKKRVGCNGSFLLCDNKTVHPYMSEQITWHWHSIYIYRNVERTCPAECARTLGNAKLGNYECRVQFVSRVGAGDGKGGWEGRLTYVGHTLRFDEA